MDSDAKVDLSNFRSTYNSEDVNVNFAEKDPLKLFNRWFNLANNTDGIKEANAMAFATADKSGKPSLRTLSLKGYGKDGFYFSTSHESRKGKELAENPQAALLFYWAPLFLQVRIEGSVVKLSEKESEGIFQSRSRSAQISSIVGTQSSAIESRESLLKRKAELEKEFSDESKVIPKPAYWGGYKLIPSSFEFWSGRTNRFHDRIRFRVPAPKEVPDEKLLHSGENGWVFEYLSP